MPSSTNHDRETGKQFKWKHISGLKHDCITFYTCRLELEVSKENCCSNTKKNSNSSFQVVPTKSAILRFTPFSAFLTPSYQYALASLDFITCISGICEGRNSKIEQKVQESF